MDKHLKEQIKTDELVSASQGAWSWVQSHAGETRTTLVVVVAVAALVGGVGYWQSNRKEAASASLSLALDTFHARVVSEAAPDAEVGGGSESYPTPQARTEKALAAFQATAQQYGTTEAGRRAQYYVGLCQLQLGKTAEAEATLLEVSNREGRTPLGGLARFALADAYRAGQKLDQAADTLRKLADEVDLVVPREYALMRLGALLEPTKRAEAAAAYRRVTEDFPASSYATEAQRRLDALKES